MEDVLEHAPDSRIRSQMGQWFPKVYGNHARADINRARYTVFWRTGNGSWSACYSGPDRQRALTSFRKFPKNAAYVEMRDTLTDELLGECGRFDYRSEISELLSKAQQCDPYALTVQKVRTRDGLRRMHVNQRELLMSRAAALYKACYLPGG